MRTFFTLLVTSLIFTGNVYAQREADLELALTEPTEGQIYYQGDTLSVGFILKNLGPDTWQADDSIAWQSSATTGALLYKVPRTVAPNDTLMFSSPVSIVSADTNLTFEFCVAAIYFNLEGTSRTITDMDDSNNGDCSNIEFRKRSVGIDDVPKAARNVVVYPNPVNTEIGFKLEGNNAGHVRVSIIDMTGRVALVRSFKWNSQSTMDVQQLSSGVYQIHIERENGERFVGKFVKN